MGQFPAHTSSFIHDGREGNVLFNDTHNTFYLQLYGIRHMVKDHSDRKTGNLLLPHGLLFPIRIIHTTANVTPFMEHWHEGLIRRPIAPLANALTTELPLAPVRNGDGGRVRAGFLLNHLH